MALSRGIRSRALIPNSSRERPIIHDLNDFFEVDEWTRFLPESGSSGGSYVSSSSSRYGRACSDGRHLMFWMLMR